MNVLVVAGYCLKVNSSANLCHVAYIRGLLDAGHSVEVLTVSDRDMLVDDGISLPDRATYYTYDASLYDRLGARKRANAEPNTAAATPEEAPQRTSLLSKIKQTVRKAYGVYETDYGWYLRAKSFRSEKHYDVVISLAYPPVSHFLAEYLIKHKRIKCTRWLQVWEDPWYADLIGMKPTEAIRTEENRILGNADEIIYVSPLTLAYQQKSFPDRADKMRWQPVPCYYTAEAEALQFDALHFGYFGDYSSAARNLLPFCQAAEAEDCRVTICGNSDISLNQTDKMDVHPRMPLSELKDYEAQANVLVFLCNRGGGQIPGKLYQYAATNKLVLFILDGTPEEQQILKGYFEPTGRFFFCENTVASVRDALRQLKNGSFTEAQHTAVDLFSPVTIVNSILRQD